MTEFEKELAVLINRHSKENDTNTPDFILAKFIQGCLAALATFTHDREKWYGRATQFVPDDKGP